MNAQQFRFKQHFRLPENFFPYQIMMSLSPEFIAARHAHALGKAAEAFAHYQQGAQNGKADCFAPLAHCYAQAIGTEEDVENALHWYKKAFKHEENTEFCNHIAELYLRWRNGKQAIYWWQKAIDLGDKTALLNYARHLSQKQSGQAELRVAKLLRQMLVDTELDDAQMLEVLDLIKKLS